MKIRNTGIWAVVVALPGVLLGAPAIASATPDQELLGLINQQRAQAKPPCAPLGQNAQLEAAADRHAKDLATNGWRNDHSGSDGSTLGRRINDAGYVFGAAAENQAQNFSAQGVVTGWMNSPGHNKNMLNCKYTQAGAASVWNGGKMYSVADFAVPLAR